MPQHLASGTIQAMKLEYLVFVGAAINIIGSMPYIRNTLRGTTKPNRVSWTLWAIVPFIGVAAALAHGVSWAVLPVFFAGFVPLLVVIASFFSHSGTWKITQFDVICAIFSVLAIIGWIISKNPLVAIALSMTADFFAGIPTLKKSWQHPESETSSPYIAGGLSCTTAFFAVDAWNFASIGFPIYLILMNTAIILALYRHRIFKTL